MGSLHESPHFVLFPFMAQGHMIPMVDIARLLAQRGVLVTIITTPRNAARFEQLLERAASSGPPISMVQLKIPFVEAGMPEGCESLDAISIADLALKFIHVVNSQEDQVEKLLEQLTPWPSCIISDMCLFYTKKIADKFQIPRIQFHGFCCLSLLCLHNIRASRTLEGLESDSEYFTVPNLPETVEFNTVQLPLTARGGEWKEIFDTIAEVDEASYGVILNTFQELEPEYIKLYKKAKNNRVWCFGPVSLSCKDNLDMSQRGNKASIDEHQCLRWLDSQEKGSVIYACLGSLSRLTHTQLVELGLGLEASNKPFIWVIRSTKEKEEFEKWILEDGFEERVKGSGLLIRGWAPQILILSHPAIGGFLTHCGWNSSVEGISSGVPLLTLPMFQDQFCNEKLVVEKLEIGVRIGVERPVVLVKKEAVQNAVEKLMDEGDEGVERRRKVKELGEMAKKAVQVGGSSYNNITLFIQDIMQIKKAKV